MLHNKDLGIGKKIGATPIKSIMLKYCRKSKIFSKFLLHALFHNFCKLFNLVISDFMAAKIFKFPAKK